jgi:hypothetical protein
MKLTITQVAKIVHDTNRSYCQCLGDHSQLLWENAPEWQRKSMIDGVKFHLANPDASPSASHERWLVVKEQAGWKYGPIKDEVKKEHPCIVPFDQLPEEQQIKDKLVKAKIDVLRQYIEK